MAATPVIGLFSILLLFSGFSLPLGMPPLPKDPMVSRVAPADCLAYVSWAGTAKPDANSANETEQLIAEPEVKKLILAIDGAISAGVSKGSQRPGPEAVIAREVYPLARTLLTSHAAVFLSKVEVSPGGPPVVQGGAIVNLAKQTTEVGNSLDRLASLSPPGLVENVEIEGAKFHRIKAIPTMPITWGIRGKYLIVGVGEEAVEGILKRAKQEPPVWLTAIEKQLPVPRPSTCCYFNVKQTIAQFGPMGGPRVKLVLDALGLDNVSSVALVTGLDEKATVSRTLVALDGEPQGIFRLAAGKPLAVADLVPIPADATVAFAGRLDASAALDLMLTQAAKVDPNARTEMTREIAELEAGLGINLQDDLLKPLGDVWCAYNSPAEGGLLVTGMTGVVQVKDHDRLEGTLAKLLVFFHDRIEQPAAERAAAQGGFARSRAPRIVKTTFAGQSICHFEATGDFPMAPAWCLTGKEFIVATFPQNIKAYLSRGKDFQSLAARPDVAAAVGTEGAVAFNYCDTRKVAEYAYPLLCFGSKALTSELSREGVTLDSSLLPSAAAIFPHLHASIGVVRRTAAGIEVSSSGPLAGMGVGPLLPVSFLFFSVARVEGPQPPMVVPQIHDELVPAK